MGKILRAEGKADCVQKFQKAIRIFHRINDATNEANVEYNIGDAYIVIPVLQDVAQADAAYQRSLNLYSPDDVLSRAKCFKQIGGIYQKRFQDAREREESMDIVSRYAKAAEEFYIQAFNICPKENVLLIALILFQFGCLYSDIGQFEDSRTFFEKAVESFEQAGNKFNAAYTRFNMALMYARASEIELSQDQKRAFLLRARAYAESALVDLQHYQGRTGEYEADTKRVIYMIDQALNERPQ